MMRLAGWRVTLGGGAGAGTPAEITGAAASIAVASIVGVPIGSQWGAAFHGSGNAVLTDRTPHPAVDLAGQFNATGANASLAGAFAATPIR